MLDLQPTKGHTVHLTIDIENPAHRALALRICELAKIAPENVSAEGFTIYRNHVTYRVFYPGPRTREYINRRTGEYVKKTRVIRNPLPRSAWVR